MSAYQPKTGQPCTCRRGIERDNCPACEGTGMRIDFAKVRAVSAAHTPGPWQFGEGCGANTSLPATFQRIFMPGNAAAFVTGSDQQANAALIAAAPDLLAALQALCGIVEDNYEAMGYATAPQALRDARAVLAKAAP